MIYLQSGRNNTLNFQFPLGWDPLTITGLTVTLQDRSGNVLGDLEDVEVTLRDPEALIAEASRYSGSLSIDDEAAAIDKGTEILIVGAAGSERQTVKGFLEGLINIELVLNNDYVVGDSVYFPSGSVSLDLSNVSDFPSGQPAVLIWTPVGTGAPITETVEIETYLQAPPAGFNDGFRKRYPRAYRALTQPEDRLPEILNQAIAKLGRKLRRSGKDIARIRDSKILAPCLMVLCAIAWTHCADDDLLEERKDLNRELADDFGDLLADPVWEDADDDLEEDDGETTSSETLFFRVF